MLLGILRVNEDIIQIHQYKVIEVLSENVIHEPLECCWGIAQAKRHHSVLEVSKLGSEGGFVFVTFLDVDLVVPGA